MASREIIILGGGGHASVIEDTLRAGDRVPAGYVAPEASEMLQCRYLGDDSWLAGKNASGFTLANGLGMIGVGGTRQALFEKFSDLGFEFETLVHGAASVSGSAVLLTGAQTLAGAVVGPHSRIGRDVIVNMSASVNHHCRIGDHVHVAPGAIICGGVTIGGGCFIGAGATIIHGLSIGARTMIAAGATVIHDLPEDSRVAGVPARNL
jgi:sugar O-acyltransferase (sialic acid O-acetyltransferase NeuD family)